MPFIVPKFIERKPKILGPLNLAQIFYIGTGVLISLYFYYTKPFPVFIFFSTILIGGGAMLSFYKVKGIPLPMVIKNFFLFSLSSKKYLWKKSGLPPKMVKKTTEKKEKEGETVVLDMAGKSKLKNLSEKTEGF